jgi:DNA-nicking Smr family endonuclease
MSGERPKSRRRLSAEEHALWRTVARSIKPLRPMILDAEPDDPPAVPSVASAQAAQGKARPAKPPPMPPKSAPQPPAMLPLAPLVRREKQRLARGTADIDARIDLHGMTQAEAHGALARFLRRAQGDGAKFALVITGKGARGAEHGERGVLRRQVPLWLKLPEFRDLVIGFENAHAAHGGDGAFYVRVRRGRGD